MDPNVVKDKLMRDPCIIKGDDSEIPYGMDSELE